MNDKLLSNLTLKWTAKVTLEALGTAMCLLLLREDLDVDAAASRASNAAAQSVLVVSMRGP